MILDLIQDGLSIDLVIHLLVRVFTIFCVLPVHEFAHAFIANKLGDPTARLSGRMTLNPLAHIDPLGSLMIILVGFGYAKGVPLNMFKFKSSRRKLYTAITAFAGPLSNILMAFISTLIYALISVYAPESNVTEILTMFFLYCSSINVSLAVFNLIPIPPLDGSRMISIILPDKYYYNIIKYEKYIVMVVFALLFFNILDLPLSILSTGLQSVISAVVFSIIV